MTENRLCSDPLPAQAMHNGFSNTKSLIMVQLVNLKYESNKERQNKKPFCFFQVAKKEKKRRNVHKDNEREKMQSKDKMCKEGKKERNPCVHLQYAIPKSHNAAGQQLWPWWFWQKWFTMVTVGLQPSVHPRTPYHSPTFLTASFPIWLDAQLKCHASAKRMHTHPINHSEKVGGDKRSGHVIHFKL